MSPKGLKTEEIASAFIRYIGQVLKRFTPGYWKMGFGILRQMLGMESSASSTNLSVVIQISKLLKMQSLSN